MKNQASLSRAGDAHNAICKHDVLTSCFRLKGRSRVSVAKILLNLVALGAITMQSAQASDNSSFLNTERLSRSFSGANSIYDLAWSPDQSKIALRGRGYIYLWDLTADEEVWSTRGAGRSLDGLVFSPDNQYVIFPSEGYAPPLYPDVAAKDASLTLLSTTPSPTTKYVKDPDFSGRINGITALAITPDGSLLVGVPGIASGRIALYDPKTWEIIKHVGEIKTSRGILVNPTMIAIDSNRKNIIGAYVDGEVQVWDYEKNVKISQFSTSVVTLEAIALNPVNGEIITGDQTRGVFQFPDGHTVGTAGDNANDLLKAWDSTTGKLVRAYPGTKYGICSISVSPDGRYIAATEGGSRVGMRLDLWNAATGELLKTIDFSTDNGLSRVKFSPDGRQLALANDNEVRIYNLTDNP